MYLTPVFDTLNPINTRETWKKMNIPKSNTYPIRHRHPSPNNIALKYSLLDHLTPGKDPSIIQTQSDKYNSAKCKTTIISISIFYCKFSFTWHDNVILMKTQSQQKHIIPFISHVKNAILVFYIPNILSSTT